MRSKMHEENWLENNCGKDCCIIGVYEGNPYLDKDFMQQMFMRYHVNHIKIKRQSINYRVTITLTANQKVITINADKDSKIIEMYYLAMEIFCFENIFEGNFYPINSFVVDEKEIVEKIRYLQQAFYNSDKRFTYFPIEMSDAEYRKYFFRWTKIRRKFKLIHPIFLFSTYLDGMPVDMRMALLLEVFEPIACMLHNGGIINLVASPTKRFQNRCSKCGAIVTRDVPNKGVTFADKLKPLIYKYGNDIFKGDNKSKIINKAVKLRNKVDHVNVNVLNVMNGGQCGFYIAKFSLLYRMIIFDMMNINMVEINKDLRNWIDAYNYRFQYLRIV